MEVESMDERQLSKWASLAEIISSVAILATLIFLVVEIRQNNAFIEQNTAVAQWTAIQVHNEAIQEVVRLWTEDPDTAAFMQRAHESYDGLSDVEKVRCRLLADMAFLTLDTIWYSYRDGVLPEPLWEREKLFLRSFAGESSCGQRVWARVNVSQPFREYVDSQVLAQN